MAQTKITVSTKEVTIDETTLAGQKMPTKELTAVVGSTTIIRRVTFGAEDGARTVVVQADVQAWLDNERQALAEEAVYLEEINGFVGNII